MSRPTRTQPQRREETRKRLLDAAARVFARTGANASVAEIAAEADCSTGAIYTHFSGKRDLLLSVFDQRFSGWEGAYIAAVSDSDTPLGAADAAAHQWTHERETEPALTQLYIEFWMAAQRDSELAQAFRERQARIIDAMSSLIEDRLESLGMESDVASPVLGAIATALADGFALQRLAGTSPEAGEMLATATRLVVQGLTKDP
ncbi:TetR/AcrR family transcriptional regulator [Tsukamurella sp. 8F]|uniref:TetR/AcrR family transcriptional regulator n=1 Tax=unclassified Tsukamurella TaxID=2633480 RepID=UPI0023B8E5B7|nr:MULTISPECIES: TetR/AcrR family transcriptional regulator [unclassified Tsukamurella]MDF0532397.1 TetR/AcrR family transcriptional regulator [Tsukamurella sp. 8J]MDF0588617.1 TetR/AcrR family transcriptional regulator [Tsukamurella sp. 8F]